ncbi:hypothetical protein [Inquilinus sp.]|jgi:hypothetical protein|uniref:hypothetical protein n=1 Tax=Inquilinus sp. TaxID=1932117 RepID=UPI0037846AC1
MRSDQVLNLVGTVLAELEGGSLSAVESPQGLLRRQRQVMVLESCIAELAPSMPPPSFRGRLAWQLPAKAAAAPNPASEEDLARRSCRIARQLTVPATAFAGASRFDAELARLVPGADAQEIRLAAFGDQPGRPSGAADRDRPAGSRLLAALAVIAAALRYSPGPAQGRAR